MSNYNERHRIYFQQEFDKLDANEQQEVLNLRDSIMGYDSFFISMANEKGIDKAKDSAKERAIVLFNRGKFHEKYGDRQHATN